LAAPVTGDHLDPPISPAFIPGLRHGVNHRFTLPAPSNHEQSVAGQPKNYEVVPSCRLRANRSRHSLPRRRYAFRNDPASRQRVTATPESDPFNTPWVITFLSLVLGHPQSSQESNSKVKSNP
jgi:hypothetical protein